MNCSLVVSRLFSYSFTVHLFLLQVLHEISFNCLQLNYMEWFLNISGLPKSLISHQHYIHYYFICVYMSVLGLCTIMAAWQLLILKLKKLSKYLKLVIHGAIYRKNIYDILSEREHILGYLGTHTILSPGLNRRIQQFMYKKI